MNKRLAFLVLLLTIGVAGCGGNKSQRSAKVLFRPNPPEESSESVPHGESFGHMGRGSTSSGDQKYQYALPYWQKNKRVVFLGVVEYPSKPLGPAYFVVIRLPPDYNGSSFSASPSINHANKPTAWIWMPHSTGGGPKIEYQVLKDSHKELFKIGQKDYDLKAGRVFLLDQAMKPPAVQQLKADLADLFGAVGTEPSREALSAAVEKLRADDQQARELLDKIEAK